MKIFVLGWQPKINLMKAQYQPHENLVFPEEVLPREKFPNIFLKNSI